MVYSLGAAYHEVNLDCFINIFIMISRSCLWETGIPPQAASQLKCSDSNQPYVRLSGIVIITKFTTSGAAAQAVIDDDEEIHSRVSWLQM